MKRYKRLIGYCLITGILYGCSGNTVDDERAAERGILSRDDAEVLVYHELSEEDKNKYTVDFYKEAGNTYYIQVYEEHQGDVDVKARYTVDAHTKEVKRIE